MHTFLSNRPDALLAFGLPGNGFEWLILLAVALLIFGRRLPEVARSFGKSINEFKKGMNEVTSEMNKEPMDQAGVDPSKLPGAMPTGMNQGGAPGVAATPRPEDRAQEPRHLS